MRKHDYSSYSTVGTNLRVEAEKAIHRAIFFGFILILAHLLEIQPSEFELGGAKFTIKDASVIYGTIALIFGYNLSRALKQTDLAFALFPMNEKPFIMRATIKQIKISNKEKKTPKQLKSQTRTMMRLSNFFLFPYYFIVTLIIMIALFYMVADIYELAKFIWINSKPVQAMKAALFA